MNREELFKHIIFRQPVIYQDIICVPIGYQAMIDSEKDRFINRVILLERNKKKETDIGRRENRKSGALAYVDTKWTIRSADTKITYRSDMLHEAMLSELKEIDRDTIKAIKEKFLYEYEYYTSIKND